MTIIDNSQRQRFDINRAPDVHVGRVSRNTVVYDVRDGRLERVSEIPERLDQRGGTRGQFFLSDLGCPSAMTESADEASPRENFLDLMS